MSKRIEKGFNFLAPVYGWLTLIIFGKTLERSQTFFLDFVKPDDHVLILGGGSGELLESLLQKHPKVSIDYIDLSSRMIDLAKKKTGNPSNVNFIIGTENTISGHTYSVVITNFYLDLFTDKTLAQVIAQIKPRVATPVTWLVTEFVSTTGWHKIFLAIMYAFFRVVTGMEATTLPDWQSALKKAGLQQITSRNFYRGFIKSSVYKSVV